MKFLVLKSPTLAPHIGFFASTCLSIVLSSRRIFAGFSVESSMMLESWRRELLDLGLRNPLLNYRLLKARGVWVVDELSAEIYTILVQQQQTMSFAAAAIDDDPTDLPQPIDRHTDRKLQTRHSDSDLQKRLHNSAHSAQTISNNRGINVLYLALGMLHWYETDDATTLRRAPLLLIPVELTRADINDRFHVRYTGVDLDENLSLRTKLQQAFDIALPPFPTDGTLHLSTYFHRVQDAIKHQPRWSIAANEISLGFFSFSKFMLYHDLLALDKRKTPLLDRLLDPGGMWALDSADHTNTSLDAQMQLADSHLVLDADSSQMKVLRDVRDGRNLVVQGPPGTGKSQTITNLIADAVGRGKTVLFVSEKMAALDVVKRRLDGVGVGDGALVLHSHRTTRSDFYDEVRRTLRLGAVAGLATDQAEFLQLEALQQAQTKLIEYSDGVNQPTNRFLPSPYDLYGRQLQLENALDTLDLPPHDAAAWQPAAAELLREWLPRVAELQTVRRQTGLPSQHPFAATTATALEAGVGDQIDVQSTITLKLLHHLQAIASELGQLLALPTPNSLHELPTLLKIAQQGASAPKLNGIAIHSTEWRDTDPETIADALQALMQAERLQLQYKPVLLPEAWEHPVFELRMGLMTGKGWWDRLRSAEYRAARAQLNGLCQNDVPPDWDAQIALIDIILEVQRLREQIKPHLEQLTRLFGDRLYEGQWHELARATYWLHTAHTAAIPAKQLQLLADGIDRERLNSLHEQLQEAATPFEKSLAILWQTAQMPPNQPVPFDELAALLGRWVKEPQRIYEMAALNQALVTFRPFPAIINALHHWSHAGSYLVEWAELAAIRQVLADVSQQRPALQDQLPHKSAEQFRQLDHAFLQHNRLRLAQAHWEKLPRYQASGLVGEMQEVLRPKRPSLPIRQFVQQFSEVIFRIKPVFMMSPLAIATYLPSSAITFDLVIFDEASQVRPAEALGAIARAWQFVVVGDSRQLPPTAFFESLGEEPDADVDTDSEGAEMEDHRHLAESILDLCLIQRVPERMLRWHYRSRHESLIAIPNAAFYNHNLVIFPQPRPRQTGCRAAFSPRARRHL